MKTTTFYTGEPHWRLIARAASGSMLAAANGETRDEAELLLARRLERNCDPRPVAEIHVGLPGHHPDPAPPETFRPSGFADIG